MTMLRAGTLALATAFAALHASPARCEFLVSGFTDAPKLAVVATPDDLEQFECAYGDSGRLSLLEKLNRCDRSRLPKLANLVVPFDWERPEIDYAPLPLQLDWAAETPKAIVVHKPLQAFAAYENGALVRWGPISSGGRNTPTPSGVFFLNWRSKGRYSTVNRNWFLRWYFNYDNRSGRSFHQYELPGLPASHGCIRLLNRDALWLYEWGGSWTLDERGLNVVSYGTPVVILGEYDYDADPPWLNPDLVRGGFGLSRAGHWIASAAESLGARLSFRDPAPIRVDADVVAAVGE